MSRNEPLRHTNNWFIPKHRRPDIVITNGGPPTQGNIRAVVEMKFKRDTLTGDQRQNYERIAGDPDDFIVMEEGKECICKDDDPPGGPVPVRDKVEETQRKPVIDWDKAALAGAAALMTVATVAAFLCPFDGPVGEAAAGTAAVGLWTQVFSGTPSI